MSINTSNKKSTYNNRIKCNWKSSVWCFHRNSSVWAGNGARANNSAGERKQSAKKSSCSRKSSFRVRWRLPCQKQTKMKRTTKSRMRKLYTTNTTPMSEENESIERSKCALKRTIPVARKTHNYWHTWGRRVSNQKWNIKFHSVELLRCDRMCEE